MKTQALLNLKIITSMVILIIFLSGCQGNNSSGQKQQSLSFPDPPDSATLFAPGIVSTFMNERDFSMTPAMDECYFTINEGNAYAIAMVKRTKEGWTNPEIVSFNSDYNDIEPFISVDGEQLFFASDRLVNGKNMGFDIWSVKRTEQGWGIPYNLGSPINSDRNEFYPSVAANGNLYFTNYKDEIMKSDATKGNYATPERLSDSVNSGVSEYNAYVAPDESFLLFSSHGWPQKMGGGDMFISYNEDGIWHKPVALDERVNSDAIDFCPYVSPDGRYFFFSSRRKASDNKIPSVYEDFYKIAQKPQNGKLDIYVVSTEVLKR